MVDRCVPVTEGGGTGFSFGNHILVLKELVFRYSGNPIKIL
jgi:hypothetical protein